MDMNRWFTIGADRHIANESRHLGLFIDRDTLVILSLPVEISEDARSERSNGSHLRRFDLFLFDEALQARNRLIAAFKDDDEGALLPARLPIDFDCIILPYIGKHGQSTVQE